LGLIALIPSSVNAEVSGPEGAGASAVNHLAASLGKQLLARPGNVVFSPWSAQSALAMMWTGAAGTTRTEMATALGINGAGDTLPASFQSLREILTKSRPKEGPCTIRSISRVFVEKGNPIEAPWTQAVRHQFGADTEPVSFSAEGAANHGAHQSMGEREHRRKDSRTLSAARFFPSDRARRRGCGVFQCPVGRAF
jgi:serine protease inhibitor